MTRSILLLAVTLVMASSRQVASSATRTSRPAFIDDTAVVVRPAPSHGHATAPISVSMSSKTLADHRYAERTRSNP